MSIPSYKRLTIALGIVCVLMLVLCGCLFWNHGWLTIRVAWATEQINIFDEMRQRALQSDAADAAGCLAYVVSYYPSGSKQKTNSRLDRMVERDRVRVTRDILAYLRIKTGQDLGEHPEVWIQKYGTR
ncbi:MAG TPA: hypothetical protein VNT99_02610 [Methylomirabilota bacterium]|nr:hypothetical protein [Methylomirabilota bacterium]